MNRSRSSPLCIDFLPLQSTLYCKVYTASSFKNSLCDSRPAGPPELVRTLGRVAPLFVFVLLCLTKLRVPHPLPRARFSFMRSDQRVGLKGCSVSSLQKRYNDRPCPKDCRFSLYRR